jgi:hypothetical protein
MSYIDWTVQHAVAVQSHKLRRVKNESMAKQGKHSNKGVPAGKDPMVTFCNRGSSMIRVSFVRVAGGYYLQI